MKKLYLSIFCVLFSISLLSQIESKQEFDNLVGFTPLMRFKYERVANPKFTYGVFLTGYPIMFPGIQMAPVARFYFKGNAPIGVYTQAKIVGGFYSRSNLIEIYDEPYEISMEGNPNREEERKQIFSSLAAGIAIGYQVLLGENSRWFADVNLGFKFSTKIPAPILARNENMIQRQDDIVWFVLGPGSFYDGLISIGYRF